MILGNKTSQLLSTEHIPLVYHRIGPSTESQSVRMIILVSDSDQFETVTICNFHFDVST